MTPEQFYAKFSELVDDMSASMRAAGPKLATHLPLEVYEDNYVLPKAALVELLSFYAARVAMPGTTEARTARRDASRAEIAAWDLWERGSREED